MEQGRSSNMLLHHISNDYNVRTKAIGITALKNRKYEMSEKELHPLNNSQQP